MKRPSRQTPRSGAAGSGKRLARMPLHPRTAAFINELTTEFYQDRLPDSWAKPYLAERLHHDITGHAGIRPGYAPDGWTALVDHLHRHGVTDLEMITAGVATTASTGRLIDRFRDRLVFPIIHHGQVLGFVGRRNPDHPDGNHGPKYLNTGETPIFNKGDQLYIVGDTQHGIAVLGEGPMDAMAVTLAGDGTHFGVAPLGTSLTDAQVAQLTEHGPNRSLPSTPTRPVAQPPNATFGCSLPCWPTRSWPTCQTQQTPPTW